MVFLDDYCERAGASGVFAEPLNLLTNAAFLLAAWWLFRMSSSIKEPFRRTADIYLLMGLLAAIGIGSGIWHAIPAAWSVLLDMLPIYLFITLYIWSYHRRVLGFRWAAVGAVWGAFLLASVVMELNVPANTWGGTVMYLPTYIVLIVMLFFTYRLAAPYFGALAKLVLLWTVSLGFRTIDLPLCPSLPIGTHFMWHVLNAVVLFGLVKLVHQQSQEKVGG